MNVLGKKTDIERVKKIVTGAKGIIKRSVDSQVDHIHNLFEENLGELVMLFSDDTQATPKDTKRDTVYGKNDTTYIFSGATAKENEYLKEDNDIKTRQLLTTIMRTCVLSNMIQSLKDSCTSDYNKELLEKAYEYINMFDIEKEKHGRTR